MRRVLGAAAIATALLVPGTASADWFGVRWPPTPPVTTIVLVDETTNPALSELVRQVAAKWSESPAIEIAYSHVDPGCKPRRNQLWVCGEDLPGAAASWVEFNALTGKGNVTIRSAIVYLNTVHLFRDENEVPGTIIYEQHLRYLVCHEMGGALGLAERNYPPEPYYIGCMDLDGPSSAYPSQDDWDTLAAVYGG